MTSIYTSISFFFFNDTATTEIYTLSLHDALPILAIVERAQHAAELACPALRRVGPELRRAERVVGDRKSTRLNSSHANISYAVFCLKKKNNRKENSTYKDEYTSHEHYTSVMC